MTEMNAVRGRVWRDGRLVSQEVAFDDLDELLSTDGVLVWLDLCRPTEGMLERLRREMSLDPLAIEDAIEPAERPKATTHPTHTFLTVYSARLEDAVGWEARESRLTTHRISAFVVERGLVTVRHDDAFPIEEVEGRWDDNAPLLRHGVGALVHGLLDAVVDGHFATIQQLDDQIEALEDLLFDEGAQQRHVQAETYRVRKELVQLRRVALPMREVVNAVLRHAVDDDASAALRGWYQDLYDHVLRASEWLDSMRDMVATIFETNLSLADARMNTIMKQLAGWAAIIAVPTLITGWFGQNVPYPGFEHLWGFYLSTALCVGCSVGLYALFKRYGWM